MNPTQTDMMDTDRPLLERFSGALARLVHEERPDALTRPVTVAELYQDIAPYRRMRDLAGIEMHADYEHALLRLLAGENGFARLEPDTARDQLAVEAEAPDPDLSAYRRFAACEVWLTPGDRAVDRAAQVPPTAHVHPPAQAYPPASDPLDMHSPRPPAAPPPPSPASHAGMAPRAVPPEPAVAAATEPAVTATPEPSSAASAERLSSALAPGDDVTVDRCGFCGQSLPENRDIRYCPYCGGDQTARPCGTCGEHLEDDWLFCVACGTAAEK